MKARETEFIALNLPDLKYLDIGIDKANSGRNDIGPKGAIAIASRLKNLRDLNISNTGIGGEGVLAIARSLKMLTTLSIGKSIAQSRQQLDR